MNEALTQRVQGHLDNIINMVAEVDDPAVRFGVCSDVWAQLHKTIVAIGPSGLRGTAARELLADEGSAASVAARIRRAGGDATTSTVKRVLG